MRELSIIVWSHHKNGVKRSFEKLRSQIDDIRFAIVVASGVVLVPIIYFNVRVIAYYKNEKDDTKYLQELILTYFIMASAFQVVCALMLLVALCIILSTFKTCFGTEKRKETNQIRLYLITFSIVFLIQSIVNILGSIEEFPFVP